jgi:hypothetical protein
MFENLFTAGVLVHIGLIFQCMGFMIRDELWLRVLVLIGSGFYVLYYLFFPELPLWDAIIASSILALVNAFLIVIIIRERTLYDMNSRESGLFTSFDTLTPGQFRRLIRLGTWHTVDSKTILTTENASLDRIYFIVAGNLNARKNGKEFDLAGEKFIGEIAFLMQTPASATIIANPGTTYVEWKSSDLRRLMKQSLQFENAFVALFNFDLARKVARSVGN